MTVPYAPRFEVRISGLTLAAEVSSQTTALSVETNLDLAGAFSLNLYNPDNTLLDSPLFDLGKTVEVHLGYGNDLKPAFLGEITAIAPSFPGEGHRPSPSPATKVLQDAPQPARADRAHLRQRLRARGSALPSRMVLSPLWIRHPECTRRSSRQKATWRS